MENIIGALFQQESAALGDEEDLIEPNCECLPLLNYSTGLIILNSSDENMDVFQGMDEQDTTLGNISVFQQKKI